jgi:hypothetical protein
MSTEYTISSNAIEYGSKGRTIPLLFPWLESATALDLLEFPA